MGDKSFVFSREKIESGFRTRPRVRFPVGLVEFCFAISRQIVVRFQSGVLITVTFLNWQLQGGPRTHLRPVSPPSLQR